MCCYNVYVSDKLSIMTTTTFEYDYDLCNYESDYCNSFLEYTNSEGLVSRSVAEKVCEDHGTTLEELLGDNVTLNGRDILEWLGY